MVTSRIALEGILQNRLTTGICNTLRMQESASDLFNLYAGKHHADDTSSSSCYAEQMSTTIIKRESHTPTTDQSEDSGVDVSAAATGSNDGRGPYKRKRTVDGYDDGDGCPTAPKSCKTSKTAAMLSVNMAVMADRNKGAATTAPSSVGCAPFRPWNSHESSSDVGLRLFHDIRNVDRILTLTQRRRESLPEPQPLDLTKGRRRRSIHESVRAERVAVERVAVEHATTMTAFPEDMAVATAVTMTTPTAEAASSAAVASTATATTTTTTGTGTTRYSKNMSRARRIEANARERSRVHTISAAFDTLRSTIPSYSRNQKLSKLSTIRIASAYILTLSRLLDMDYSAEQDRPSVDECVDNITSIIHMEGKAKKKKDDQ